MHDISSLLLKTELVLLLPDLRLTHCLSQPNATGDNFKWQVLTCQRGANGRDVYFPGCVWLRSALVLYGIEKSSHSLMRDCDMHGDMHGDLLVHTLLLNRFKNSSTRTQTHRDTHAHRTRAHVHAHAHTHTHTHTQIYVHVLYVYDRAY